jgi:hypothetical protein
VGSGACLDGLQRRNTFIFVGNRATVCQSPSHFADAFTKCSRYGCVGVRLLNRCLNTGTCACQTDVSAMVSMKTGIY